VGVDYDLNPRDRLSLEGSLFSFGLKPGRADDAGGLERRRRRAPREQPRFRERVRQREQEPSRVLAPQAERDGARAARRPHLGHVRQLQRRPDPGDSLVPAGADAFEFNRNTIDRDEQRAKFEYAKPMGENRKLRIGYEGAFSDTGFDTQRRRGADPSSLVLDTRFSNAFEYEQDVHAAYGTYERPFGEKLTAQFGLGWSR
jgi:hypothetical protein